MTPCVVCTVHMETRGAGFFIEPQNQGQRFISGLASKPLGRFVSGLASKPLRRFISGLTSKPVVTVFSVLASKPVVAVSPVSASKSMVSFLVKPQNQGGEGFLGLGHKTGSYGLVIWSSKSP
jgi:hypothetical protein